MQRGGSVTPKPTATQSAGDSEPSSEPNSERGIVTALSYDLVGSTSLFHQLDIEDFQELMDAFQDAVRQAITSCSGVIRNTAGDGGVALFPIELDPTDAASLAIRAGLQIIEACRRVGREAGRSDLHVRIGVATSIAVIQESNREDPKREPVTGAAPAKATRLEAIAAPDTVFVSNETRNLAGRSYAFTFQGKRLLKGFSEPEKVWRAAEHKRRVDRFYSFGNLGGEFVGRSHELERIDESWRSRPYRRRRRHRQVAASS
jgi:class 3 adenylate cyclase